MNTREQQRRFLKVVRTIARQALALPPYERSAFIRCEIASLQQMYEPLYKGKASSPGRDLLNSMERWVEKMVRILEQDEGPSKGVQRK